MQWVKDRTAPKLYGPTHGPCRVVVHDPAEGRFVWRNIANGIEYARGDGDMGIQMVYDRDTGRAYFHFHSR
jgi:hypothetical protein